MAGTKKVQISEETGIDPPSINWLVMALLRDVLV